MSQKRPMNQENSFVDLDIPNECKEYLLTEWTTDHGHTSWWSHRACIAQWGEDRDEWHCMLIECRIMPDANILTRKQIAEAFRIDIDAMIILD